MESQGTTHSFCYVPLLTSPSQRLFTRNRYDWTERFLNYYHFFTERLTVVGLVFIPVFTPNPGITRTMHCAFSGREATFNSALEI